MGMDLVPVYEGDEVASGATISIDPVTVQNMGVRVAEVKTHSLTRRVRTIGEVVVEGDSREGVFAFPVVLEPWRGLHLLAGPGFERSKEEGTSFLFRVGAGWGFELGERYALTPAVELDFVDGEEGVERVLVFGASFGFTF